MRIVTVGEKTTSYFIPYSLDEVLSKQAVCTWSTQHASAILSGPGVPWTNNTVSAIKEFRVC